MVYQFIETLTKHQAGMFPSKFRKSHMYESYVLCLKVSVYEHVSYSSVVLHCFARYSPNSVTPKYHNLLYISYIIYPYPTIPDDTFLIFHQIPICASHSTQATIASYPRSLRRDALREALALRSGHADGGGSFTWEK